MSKEYWTDDEEISRATFHGETYGVRLRTHTHRERYRAREKLYPLAYRDGERAYVHGRPYILIPEIALTIRLHANPNRPSEVGTVERSEWMGMRHQEIGNAQAWYYLQDRTTILWECFLNDHWRADDPTQDANLKALWSGFERLLLRRFQLVDRIVTPSWEPIYEEDGLWHRFLQGQGFERHSERAFIKDVE